jgi:DNA polymerase
MFITQFKPKVPVLFLDTETFSETNIKTAGAVKYGENAEMLLAGFRLGDKYEVWDYTENKPIPTWVFEHINNGGLVAAWNALFDYVILKEHIFSLKLDQVIDLMAMASAAALPMSLEKCGEALGLAEDKVKLKEGKRLVKKFCVPRKPTKNNPATRILPQDDPEDWDMFKNEYLRMDIESMIHISEMLPWLMPEEQQAWVDTQVINLAGVPIDGGTCQLIIKKLDKLIDDESSKFIRLTSLFPTQRDKVLKWVQNQGVRVTNLQAATVQSVLDNPKTPEVVVEALTARANTTHMSFKKFPTMLATMCEDGTVKGSLMYHVAGTGRFGGRLIQTQNLTRGSVETNEAVKRIQDGEFSVELVKSAVRGMIYSPDGLAIADYSGIEARVVQWLCQDEEALAVFHEGKDPYKWMASKIYGVHYDDVTKDQRFTGKQAILGLGYQMSAKKFIEMVESYGETISEDEAKLAVRIYRDTHKKLVRFWSSINQGAVMALDRPEREVKVNKYIRFIYEGKFLYMILPSGRRLSYYQPRIEPAKWAGGEPTFSYMSMNEKNQYVRTHTYGGKLTENAVQAIARDLLVAAIRRLLEKGIRIITHVHDEIVANDREVLNEMMKLMCLLPEWAEGIPLEAEGFTSDRFKKG